MCCDESLLTLPDEEARVTRGRPCHRIQTDLYYAKPEGLNFTLWPLPWPRHLQVSFLLHKTERKHGLDINSVRDAVRNCCWKSLENSISASRMPVE